MSKIIKDDFYINTEEKQLKHKENLPKRKKKKLIANTGLKNNNIHENYEIIVFKPHLIFNLEKKNYKINKNKIKVFNKNLQLRNHSDGISSSDKTFLRKSRVRLTKFPKYILDHESKLAKNLISINLVLIIYSVTIIPAVIINLNYSFIFQLIENFIDVFFIIFFFINFLKTYKNHNNEKIYDIKKIIIRYIFTWFFWDLILNIPFSIISSSLNLIIEYDVKVYYILNMFKILRVIKFLKNVKYFKPFWVKKIKIKSFYERIITSVFIIFIFIHNIACLWILVALYNIKESNWIFNNNINYESIYIKYLYSFYWTTQTIFTVGYGDIVVINKIERFIAVIIMFIGVFVYSFLVSSISSIINQLDKNKENIIQNKKFLNAIEKKYNITKKFYKRLENFINKNKFIEENEEKFINELKFSLKKEILYEININKLNEIEYFKNKSYEFITYVSPYLKLLEFSKNNNIFVEKEKSNEIYFIKTGKVRLYKNLNDKNIFIKEIKKGDYFGEIELLSGKNKRIFTAISIDNNTQVLTLQYEKAQNVYFKYHNKDGEELIKKGILRKFEYNKIFQNQKNKLKLNKSIFKLLSANFKPNTNNLKLFIIKQLFFNKFKYKQLEDIKHLHIIFKTHLLISNISNFLIILNKLAILNKKSKNKKSRRNKKNTFISKINAEINNKIDITKLEGIINNPNKNLNLSILINNYNNFNLK